MDYMSFITLVRPPFVYSKLAVSKPVVPSIGVAYLSSSLREAGHLVDVIDALGEGISHSGPATHPKLVYRGLPIEKILERIHPNTSAIGVSGMFSLEWPHTESILLNIQKRFPSLPIVIGGEHATATYEYILNTCPAVFCVVLGEGEHTLCELADFFDGKKKLREIQGIAYRENGSIVKTVSRPRIRHLDALPLPAWDLIPIHKYHEAAWSYGVDRGKSMPILATRGCPYQCTFCSNPLMWTTRYYVRTPSKVVDEIQLYLHQYKATNIDFNDLTAILKREWILEFCKEILKRKLEFTWQLPVGTRSECIDAEVLDYLYESGCRNICYAPESGSEQVLKDVKKRVNLRRLNHSLKEAKKKGLNVRASLILGFPQETRKDMYKTLLLIVKYAWMGLDDSGIFAFSPYPGSELYEYLKQRGKISELNNDYFASLAGFVDLLTPISYCENVGALELSFYRILGMALFYFVAFLRSPLRIFKTFRNVLRNTSETVFEQRVLDFIKRNGFKMRESKVGNLMFPERK